jgi:hypothetical protein
MKTMIYALTVITVSVITFSCIKDNNNPDLEQFCSVAKTGWECLLFKNDFSPGDIPRNADKPVAIIKYKNPSREFTISDNIKVNPSLTLDFYSIKQKEALIGFIKSQLMYSWCIPVYYGETKDFFILTSPCFINSGIFTAKADSSISDLHKALEKIIIKKDYGFFD